MYGTIELNCIHLTHLSICNTNYSTNYKLINYNLSTDGCIYKNEKYHEMHYTDNCKTNKTIYLFIY